MKTARRRHPRGWVLIAVLAVLLLLSLLVAGFFAQSQDAAAMTRVNMGQQLAMSHAEFAVQEAVRALRSQQIPVTGLAGTCTDTEIIDNTCPNVIASPLVDNGSGSDLGTMGGLQYQYIVYKRFTTDPAQPPNRYMVRATGYYGYTLTSNSLVTSIIEVEVDVGKGNNRCTSADYECQM
jgi:type II secretory pathway pseudopilin PulG